MLPRTLEPEVMDTVEEATDYDSMDHGEVNRRFVEDLLQCVDQADRLPAGEIVDLGTGTALIPIELVSQRPDLNPILACDLSQEMLKLAQQHLQQLNLCHLISTVFCDAKQLPMGDDSCRLIMSNSIIHHIPEPLQALHEINRIAAAGAVVLIRDLMRPESAQTVEEIVEQYAGEENEHQQKMFRESLHAALTVQEVEDLLHASGLNSLTVAATSDRHWTVSGIYQPVC